jgi:hypothetical protein
MSIDWIQLTDDLVQCLAIAIVMMLFYVSQNVTNFWTI